MKVEEKLYLDKKMLGYAVEDFVYSGNGIAAISINKRNKLLEEGYIKKKETIDFLKNNEECIVCSDNSLYTKDNFCN